MSGQIKLSSVVARHEAAMMDAVRSQGYGPDRGRAGELSLLQYIHAGSVFTQAPSHLGPLCPPWEESGRSVKLTTYRLVLRLKIYIAVPPLHMMPL